MAKHRIVKSDFWVDEYIEILGIRERYLFLYLLTNPDTNIVGIYKTTLRRMAFDTGLSAENIEQILKRFSEDDKAHFIDSHILMVNFQKHQIPNEKMVIGIRRIFDSLPSSVIVFIKSKKSKIYDSLYKAYIYPHIYKDKDKNINKDKNTTKAPDPESFKPSESFMKWYKKNGFPKEALEIHTEMCFNNFSAKGVYRSDWEKTLQNWVRKDLDGINTKRSNGKNKLLKRMANG